MKKTETYEIATAMGSLLSSKLPFLTEEETSEFNLVGNTGKNSKGERTHPEEYLNSLGKGVFKITQTKSDSGTFTEKFIVSRVVEPSGDVTIETYDIRTSMGSLYFSKLPFLSEEEVKEFNTIGYTGKNTAGEPSDWTGYLNSLGKGVFSITKTKWDNGNFIEGFSISRAYQEGH